MEETAVSKYKKLVSCLIILNFVAIIMGTGIYLRFNKLHKDDNRFLAESQEYATAVSKRDGLPQQTVLDGQLLEHHIVRDGHISDADLDKLIQTIESSFAQNKSGSALLSYGFGFLYMKSAPAAQKDKVGRLCVKVLLEATSDDKRMYALRVISLSDIASVRPQLTPFVQDRNAEIAEKTRLLISRFDKATK